MINNEAKIKAVLAICLFTISMIVVASISYEYGRQDGYVEGYSDADEDWRNYLNEVWDDFVDAVYQEGYDDGYRDGFLWGWVNAWLEYGADESFQHPGGNVP